MGRINGLGRQHRIDFGMEKIIQKFTLFFRELAVAPEAHAFFSQLA